MHVSIGKKRSHFMYISYNIPINVKCRVPTPGERNNKIKLFDNTKTLFYTQTVEKQLKSILK